MAAPPFVDLPAIVRQTAMPPWAAAKRFTFLQQPQFAPLPKKLWKSADECGKIKGSCAFEAQTFASEAQLHKSKPLYSLFPALILLLRGAGSAFLPLGPSSFLIAWPKVTKLSL